MATFTSLLTSFTLAALFASIPTLFASNDDARFISSPVLHEGLQSVDTSFGAFEQIQPHPPDGMVVYQDWRSVDARLQTAEPVSI